MTFAYTPYTLPFVVSSIIIIALWLFTFPYRHEASTRAFWGLLLTVFIWTAGFIFEIMGNELQTKLLFANIQFLGITAIPIAFLTLTMQITARGQKLKYLIYVLGAFFLIANTVIWTDGFHHWFRQNPHLDVNSGPFPILVNDYGFWFYYIQTPIFYSIHLITLVLIVQAWIFAAKPYRSQAGILLVSFIIPLLVDAMYVLGITPIPNFNYTSAAFSFSGILIAFALFQYRLFDIVPMANDLIVRNFSEGVIVLNHNNRLIEINPSACQIIRVSPKEAIGGSAENILWFAKDLAPNPKNDQKVITIHREGLDGNKQYYDLTTTKIKNRRGIMVGTLITIQDVTERQRSLMETRILATTDSLTGAFNRRHFFELLETELTRASRFSTPLAVIMFDIDDFKHFNDKYGHAIGDEILIIVTRTCQANLRNLDSLGRHGGDEFVILLPHANSTLAAYVAKRLCRLISEIIVMKNEQQISVTVSIGVVGYHGHEKITADKLLQTADKAMYQAKENGKNQAVIISLDDEN